MNNLLSKKLIAVTIISTCLTVNVYAADTLDKAQLINAAKQIGQPSEFEDFEEALAPEDTTEPKALVVNSVSNSVEAEHKNKAMGALPAGASYRKRLALYGKQKLVIHNPGENLKLSIEGLTKALATRPVNENEEPISMNNELVEPFNDEVLIKPMPTTPRLESREPIPVQNKLKDSVSQLKSLFASKVVDSAS